MVGAQAGIFLGDCIRTADCQRAEEGFTIQYF